MAIPKRRTGLFGPDADLDGQISARDQPSNAPRDATPASKDPVPPEPDDLAADGERIRVTIRPTIAQTEQLEDDLRVIHRALRVRLSRTGLVRAILEGYRRSGYRLSMEGLTPRTSAESLEEEIAEQIARRLGAAEETP